MADVYLGIGSNIDAAPNLRLGIRELQCRFGKVEVSRVYRNAPFGFEGEDFLNAVVHLRTDLKPEAILQVLNDIHEIAGRRRDQNQISSRTLDIDLLLYDRLVVDSPGLHLPRSDVLLYSFVLRPLAELAPDYVHPLTGRRLAEHWREFDAARHPLRKVELFSGAET